MDTEAKDACTMNIETAGSLIVTTQPSEASGVQLQGQESSNTECQHQLDWPRNSTADEEREHGVFTNTKTVEEDLSPSRKEEDNIERKDEDSFQRKEEDNTEATEKEADRSYLYKEGDQSSKTESQGKGDGDSIRAEMDDDQWKLIENKTELQQVGGHKMLDEDLSPDSNKDKSDVEKRKQTEQLPTDDENQLILIRPKEHNTHSKGQRSNIVSREGIECMSGNPDKSSLQDDIGAEENTTLIDDGKEYKQVSDANRNDEGHEGAVLMEEQNLIEGSQCIGLHQRTAHSQKDREKEKQIQPGKSLQPIATEIQCNTKGEATHCLNLLPHNIILMILFKSVIIFVLVMLVARYLVTDTDTDHVLVPTEVTPCSKEQLTMDSFSVSMKKLRENFVHIDNHGAATISAAVKSVIRSNPKQPAVIMMGTSLHMKETGTNLTIAVAEAVNRAFGTRRRALFINATTHYASRNPRAAKMTLDNSLKAQFMGSGRVSVLYELQDLPGEAAMILHSYCDNDNAPFKKVVLLFTMTVPELNNSNVLRGERQVEEFLLKTWRPTLGVDKTTALLSRITPSVVLLI